MPNVIVKPAVKAVTKEVVVHAAQPAQVTLVISPLELAILFNALGEAHGNNGWLLYQSMESALRDLGINHDAISEACRPGDLSKEVLDVAIPAIVREAGH